MDDAAVDRGNRQRRFDAVIPQIEIAVSVPAPLLDRIERLAAYREKPVQSWVADWLRTCASLDERMRDDLTAFEDARRSR